MLKGFKDFLLRGNVVDLAVAVVIGAAFTAVVTSFTKSFLEPLLRLFSGGEGAIPPGTIPLTDEVQLDYASFLNAIVTFFITAAVIYFLIVFPMKWLQERRRSGEEDGPSESTDVELLTEIRDLLLAQEKRAERLDALGAGAGAGGDSGSAGRTTQLPPQPPNGYEPYPDSPYTGPSHGEPAYAERSSAGPAYAGRSHGERSYAEPAHSGHNDSEPAHSEPAHSGHAYSEPGYPEHSYAEPAHSGPAYADRSAEEPSHAEPTQRLPRPSPDGQASRRHSRHADPG